MLTIGQYLRPTAKHADLDRYVEPSEFARYEHEGTLMGYKFVASGPLVRSSYRAAEAFLHGILKEGALGEEMTRSPKANEGFDRYGKKRLEILR